METRSNGSRSAVERHNVSHLPTLEAHNAQAQRRAEVRRTLIRTYWHTYDLRGRQKNMADFLNVDVSTIRRDVAALRREGWAP